MHNLKRVQTTNTHDYLLSYLRRIVLVQILVLLHKLKQVCTIHQLSYYIDVRLRQYALLELQKQGV